MVCALLVLTSAAAANANDRLPPRIRALYGQGLTEAQKYLRYLLEKVWGERVADLAKKGLPPPARRGAVDSMVDEIVELVLPQAGRYVRAVLYGTHGTHLAITRPELAKVRAQARFSTPALTAHEAVAALGGAAERALEDRIEHALAEDLGELATAWVEGAVGLRPQGRSRARVRALPEKWESTYQGLARPNAHELAYWWLRKRRRLELGHMALSLRAKELDRARHEGPVWGLTGGLSQEVWAQNRLRLDFKWGRPNWEIDRRNLRRRLDQDLAEATWAMARHARELLRGDVTRAAREHLRRSVREALSKDPLRRKAEAYPATRPELERDLGGLTKELDPLAERAMGKVPLPEDMTPPLRALSHKHGRRFFREEMGGAIGGAIAAEAPLHAAHKRARDTLPGHVADAIARLDLGARAGEAAAGRSRAVDEVKRTALPKVREDVVDTLRRAGQDELRPERASDADEVIRRFAIEKQLEEEANRQLDAARAPR